MQGHLKPAGTQYSFISCSDVLLLWNVWGHLMYCFAYLVVRPGISCSKTFISCFLRRHTLLLGRFLNSDLGLGCCFVPCSWICLCHPDCETLIRRMLVVDPTKRITISQIKQHKWMQADPSLQQQQSLSFSMQNYNSNLGDYNEQVLGIMQTLGIDRQRTVEVRSACPLDKSSVTTRMP